MSLLLRLILFPVLLGAVVAETVHAAPPNFLIIFTDDHGYGDVSTYGAKDVQTPNPHFSHPAGLSRIFGQGLTFG